MPRERTHWDGCWRERTHHDCALVRIAALKAELAAERKRREDAEALLHEADKDWVAMGYAGWLEFNKRLLTHFARYKD